jgi:hypothetical protein
MNGVVYNTSARMVKIAIHCRVSGAPPAGKQGGEASGVRHPCVLPAVGGDHRDDAVADHSGGAHLWDRERAMRPQPLRQRSPRRQLHDDPRTGVLSDNVGDLDESHVTDTSEARASLSASAVLAARVAADACPIAMPCLSMTGRASTSSSASETRPIPPEPSTARSRYRPTTSRPGDWTAGPPHRWFCTARDASLRGIRLQRPCAPAGARAIRRPPTVPDRGQGAHRLRWHMGPMCQRHRRAPLAQSRSRMPAQWQWVDTETARRGRMLSDPATAMP